MINPWNTIINQEWRISKVAAGAIAIFAILLLVYVASIDIRATRGASITGDEPFYLLTTQSLIEDRNLDLRSQYELHSYESFFDHPDGLWMQSSAREDGKVLSPHNPGLSVLVIPGFGIGGLIGAQIQMMIIAALTFSLAYILIVRISGEFWISWLTTVAWLSQHLLSFIPLRSILSPCRLISHHLSLNHPKNQPIKHMASHRLTDLPDFNGLARGKICPSSGFSSYVGILAHGFTKALHFLGLHNLSATLFTWFHLETFGGLTPYSVNLVYAGDGTINILGDHLDFTQRIYRPLGLFIDERFGIGRWAPILLFVLPTAPLLWKITGSSRLILALILTQILIATFIAITMMGWWFPGRTIITVLPLMTLPLVILLMQSPLWVRLTLGVLGIYSLVITALLAVSGHTREIVIAVDPFDMSSPIFQLIAPMVPDYRMWNAHTWIFTVIWLSIMGILTLAFYFSTAFNQFDRSADISEN
ncbi:MAG: hypothetical protein CM1200mP22_21610 [Dehalococcoidia bacterium]|nr:MAG: hypothetical protein CM1200mP22_21610 [Dehalococcoidia bacterium]